MKKLGLYVLIICCLSISACDKEVIIEPEGLEWDYGKNEYNLEIDGVERNFLIHVPQKYSDEIEVPMVFMLHGSSGDGTKFYNISRWVEKADEEGFIAVFPTALAYKIKGTNITSTKWSSAGLPSVVEEGTIIKDDIPFIEGLVEICQQTFKIDSKKFYISGFSNGGALVNTQVLSRLSELFAAASAAGGIGNVEEMDEHNNRKIPFHNIAGTMDEGNMAIMKPKGTVVPIQINEIKKQDKIWSHIQKTLNGLDLTEDFTELSSAPKYNAITFNNDLSGEGNEYVLLLVNELEHNYPNEINNPHQVVAADILWEWFSKWELE